MYQVLRQVGNFEVHRARSHCEVLKGMGRQTQRQSISRPHVANASNVKLCINPGDLESYRSL